MSFNNEYWSIKLMCKSHTGWGGISNWQVKCIFESIDGVISHVRGDGLDDMGFETSADFERLLLPNIAASPNAGQCRLMVRDLDNTMKSGDPCYNDVVTYSWRGRLMRGAAGAITNDHDIGYTAGMAGESKDSGKSREWLEGWMEGNYDKDRKKTIKQYLRKGFYGAYWMTPDGDMRKLGSAREHEDYIKNQGFESMQDAMMQGWIRIASAGDTLYIVAGQEPSGSQKAALIDFAENRGFDQVVRDHGNRGTRVLWSMGDQL